MNARQKAQQIVDHARESHGMSMQLETHLINLITEALQEAAKVDDVDLWKGRHVTDGKVCLTCGGIDLKECPVIYPKNVGRCKFPPPINEGEWVHCAHQSETELLRKRVQKLEAGLNSILDNTSCASQKCEIIAMQALADDKASEGGK